MGKVYTVFDGNNFATKKYVDESISAIPEVDISNLVPYTGATKDVDLDQYKLNAKTLILKDGQANVWVSINGITANGITTPFLFRINDDSGNANFTFRRNADLVSPVIGEPTADNQAATKKYVDDKIHVSNVHFYFENVDPSNTWSRYDFNKGEFMNIPWDDFLGATVWVLQGKGAIKNEGELDVDLKWIPFDKAKRFGGLLCYHRVTGSTATSFTICAKITYRK